MWKILESRTKDILQNKPKVKLEEKEAKHKFAKHPNLKTKKKKQSRKIYNNIEISKNTTSFSFLQYNIHKYTPEVHTITNQDTALMPSHITFYITIRCQVVIVQKTIPISCTLTDAPEPSKHQSTTYLTDPKLQI